jgi:adenosine deaminase/aminodeoxyfutalosine deaminase
MLVLWQLMTENLPRAELHLHLEGSLALATLKELDPSLADEEIARVLHYSNFDEFIGAYVWVNRKLRTPADYALIARRLFADLAAQGISYAEVIVSAGVILWKKQDLGAVFDALEAEAKRSPVPIRWIFDATRQWGALAAEPVFKFAAENQHRGIVGIGLGGFEELGPARWFTVLFERARDRGLRLTCHAGETTGPESVWDALSIGTERIGHGIRAIEDPRLLEELRNRDVPLEISISSNVRTGAVPRLVDHPVRYLFDAGVPIILNTDDPALFGCTLDSEYALAQKEFGFTCEELRRLAANSFRYAFTNAAEADRAAATR